MSQENIELARRVNMLNNACEWDAVFEHFAEDIEWRDRMHAPDVPEVIHGIAAVRALATQWEAAYEGLEAEVLEYIDADPWVICVTRWHARGRGSGTPVEVHSVDAYEIANGKIIRSFGGNPDLASAREAIEQATR